MTMEELGLNAQRLIAGFAGGVVHAFAFKQADPFTANFLGPAAFHYIGPWVGDGGSAFAVGLSAMAVCQGIVAAASRVRFNNSSDKKRDHE